MKDLPSFDGSRRAEESVTKGIEWHQVSSVWLVNSFSRQDVKQKI